MYEMTEKMSVSFVKDLAMPRMYRNPPRHKRGRERGSPV